MELREYRAMSGDDAGTAEAARARRVQGRQIATRLTELLTFGIRIRWHDSDGDGVRLRCQRSRR